jgi:hypothetical protein
MEKKHIISASCRHLRAGHFHEKLLSEKFLLPIGNDSGFLTSETEIQVKFNDSHGDLVLADEVSLEQMKDEYCLKMRRDKFDIVLDCLRASDYVFIVFEGSNERTTAILCFYARINAPFETVQTENPTLRLEASDLPPVETVSIEVTAVKAAFYKVLARNHPHLFSLGAQRFLSTPHILTHLFAQVMSLSSADNISYISTLRVLADQIRLLATSRIRKLEKDHHKLWATFYGERIGFLDGGMSRVVGLPGTEPTGIRVGIYTVIPGERDLDKRESWNLRSYVIGDVVNDRSAIREPHSRTDTKRLQEATRYILEPLNALLYANSLEGQSLKLFLLHGPLQYPFMVYDELEPSYIPSVDKKFLAGVDILEEDVLATVPDIPTGSDGKPLWNSCIPIYLYIMRRLWASGVPIAGVVERARSASFALRLIDSLVEEESIPRSTAKRLKTSILQHEIGDELLFGCVLEEGEYISPLEVQKNFKHRAHDNWQPVVDQFPKPVATMLKCSATNFPYRVEMPTCPSPIQLESRMSLLYHMSLLLPNYAFPVGIDIADKYAKIPDWLSKGISESLTAAVLKKLLRTGDERTLMQVRRLLALSPRDFFFRPKA